MRMVSDPFYFSYVFSWSEFTASIPPSFTGVVVKSWGVKWWELSRVASMARVRLNGAAKQRPLRFGLGFSMKPRKCSSGRACIVDCRDYFIIIATPTHLTPRGFGKTRGNRLQQFSYPDLKFSGDWGLKILFCTPIPYHLKNYI